MGVHFQIALAFEQQIDHCVPGKQGQHVVEEGHAGLDGRFTGPIDVQLDQNPRLFGVTFDLRMANVHP
jgi:uncharacterized protein (UPF0262 family)